MLITGSPVAIMAMSCVSSRTVNGAVIMTLIYCQADVFFLWEGLVFRDIPCCQNNEACFQCWLLWTIIMNFY